MAFLPHRKHSDAEAPPVTERVVERRYAEDGRIQWERAGVRVVQPPALPAPQALDDPVWLEVLVWVLGGFLRGLELLGEALLGLLALVLGVVAAVLAVTAAVGLAIGILSLGYWIGSVAGGNQGGLIGIGVSVGVIILTLFGAADRARR
jgi:hypothetical protein